jgi:PAS domain S-box-containing protein
MIDMGFSPKRGFSKKVQRSAARALLGGLGLSLVTFLASPFETHRGAVALIYLMIVAFVSLTGDLVSSACVAISATLCLRYFFAPPLSTPGIDKPLDVAALITFLATAAIITRLISKMQRLTEELRRREAYLAEAQRFSHTGSFGWRLSTGEILWSEESFRIFQYEQTTKPTVELILARVHPEDAALVKQTIERTAQTRNDFEHEYRLVMPDSSVKYIHVVAHVLSDEPDSVEFVGAVMDVTAVKQAEEALRRSEGYLAEAQRLSHTGSWASIPAMGEIRYMSEECYRVLGFDPRGGQPRYEAFFEHIHPDDQAKVSEAIATAGREKAEFQLDYRIVHPGGEIRDIHAVGHPVFSPSGDLVEFVGTVIDITERKRSEESLRRSEGYLAEAQRLSHTGSWAWAPAAGEISYFSDECYRMLGFDPHQGLPRVETFFQRIHPDDRARSVEQFERASRKKTEFEFDYRIVHPGGDIRDIHTVGHPVFSSSGDHLEYVGTVIDITERKRAEEERERLRQAEADLARVNRVTTMGELTASLAHEVNQPIAAAVTSANSCYRWLASDVPNLEKARAAAMRIVSDGTRAAAIISRIRLLFQKGTPQKELVDVNEIIGEMIVLLSGEATRHSMSVRTELAADLPRVMGDRVQLQQVMMNLMINSIDAMKAVDGTRDLVIGSQRAENEQLKVSVSDTGVGLPPQQPDQIFDAFFTTKPHGTGMGLRICRSIVESHGGRLWAANNSPRGASFHFALPTKIEARE